VNEKNYKNKNINYLLYQSAHAISTVKRHERESPEASRLFLKSFLHQHAILNVSFYEYVVPGTEQVLSGIASTHQRTKKFTVD
jgi:hypothetical protein